MKLLREKISLSLFVRISDSRKNSISCGEKRIKKKKISFFFFGIKIYPQIVCESGHHAAILPLVNIRTLRKYIYIYRKPYSFSTRRIFNYRFSPAKHVAANACGVFFLVSVFRKPILSVAIDVLSLCVRASRTIYLYVYYLPRMKRETREICTCV